MKQTFFLTATAILSTVAALHAAPGEPGHHHDEMAVGEPGSAEAVDRTIDVRMLETNDGQMLFEPASLEVREGETIRFALSNTGATDHEFVLDDHAANQEHKELMQRFPEMEHDDPNSVRLAPGETGEIVWTFTSAGTFEYACLIPGHYEAGMHSDIRVTDEAASN